MKLERAIEFSEPITGLAVNTAAENDPLIRVALRTRAQVVVHASTGERYNGIGNSPFGRELIGATFRPGFRGIPEAVLVGATTAVSAEAGNVRLRDVRTGRPLRVAAHPSPVTSLVSYTGPDGRPRIASGDAEGTLRIWDPAPPDGTRIGSVSTRGFNDHVADTDLLNRTALAYALNQVLEPGDGPTVITIEGAWGSGKSSVLHFMRRALTRNLDKAPRGRKLRVFGADRMLYRPPAHALSAKAPSKRLVASFNPWRHQSSEQVWAGLAQAVAAAAEPAIMPDLSSATRSPALSRIP